LRARLCFVDDAPGMWHRVGLHWCRQCAQRNDRSWQAASACGSLEEKSMKTILATAAFAALALGSTVAANAMTLSGVHSNDSATLVQQTGYHHRHKHCAVRHGHRHCWWK